MYAFSSSLKKILSEVQLNLEVDVNFVGNEETSKSEKAQKIMERLLRKWILFLRQIDVTMQIDFNSLRRKCITCYFWTTTITFCNYKC